MTYTSLQESFLPSPFYSHRSFASDFFSGSSQYGFLAALSCIGRQSRSNRLSLFSVSSSFTKLLKSFPHFDSELFARPHAVPAVRAERFIDGSVDQGEAGHVQRELRAPGKSNCAVNAEVFSVERSIGKEGTEYATQEHIHKSIIPGDHTFSLGDDDDTSDDETDGIVYDMDAIVDLEMDCAKLQSEDEEDNDAFISSSVVFKAGAEAKAERRKRVQDLLRRKQTDDNFLITVDDLASLYDFSIDKFQYLAIEGFLKGSSVVVCAPTSSGKTLIAEAAAAAALAMGRRLFYTTPLKALSNQKLREFRDMFGEANVGLLTGDAAVNKEAPILIMTTEILRNMLYQSVGTLDEDDRLQYVMAVVLDEVHYLSDISRGTVWEETVIYCPKEIQLICLSATIANPDELAGWIAQVHGPTELITSKRRPVPLSWHFSTRYSLSPLLNEEATAMNRRLSLARVFEDMGGNGMGENSKLKNSKANISGINERFETRGRQRKRDRWQEPRALSDEELQFLRRRQVPRVEETLMELSDRRMLPAIWFIFSRKGCDTAVQYVRNVQLLSDDERSQVHKALETFRKEFPDAVRESALSALLRGFASHHAGCLPLWKAFIEELFQKGLIKVVFATETLAAGINMPARATILSSLSKRGDSGHSLLTPNAMLQMAGRAGRRGLDERGHVVVVQTPFEGAEEACKLLFSGPDPLVSQFTASYGMVLNLLSGIKSSDGKVLRHGRTLEEARALIEQSFGNYVGNDIKAEAMQHVSKLQERINKLQREKIPDVRSRLTNEEVEEYMNMKECLKAEKQFLKVLRDKLEHTRLALVQPCLVEALKVQLPFICLSYNDSHSGDEQVVAAMCIGIIPDPDFLALERLVDYPVLEDDEAEINPAMKISIPPEDNIPQICCDVLYFVALGADNCWYAFTAAAVQCVSKAGLTKASVSPGEFLLKDNLMEKVPHQSEFWRIIGKSGSRLLGSVRFSEGSVDTWPWSANVPPKSSIVEEMQVPQELLQAEYLYKQQRKKVSRVKKDIKSTKASREYLQMLGIQKLQEAKVAQLEGKRLRILDRIDHMQPSGWKEFLQVVKVLEDVGAITPASHDMLSLGETAASIRGVNELWLALAFSNAVLLDLNPAQLASVCGSFVAEGIKIRSDVGLSDIYMPSSTVKHAVDVLAQHRQQLMELQNNHGVLIPCDLDDQVIGLVEAWASGVTWKELMIDCGMDEGDLARLLRRSIDLLAQLPFLRHLDPCLHKTARSAADVMDRTPISELIA